MLLGEASVQKVDVDGILLIRQCQGNAIMLRIGIQLSRRVTKLQIETIFVDSSRDVVGLRIYTMVQ